MGPTLRGVSRRCVRGSQAISLTNYIREKLGGSDNGHLIKLAAHGGSRRLRRHYFVRIVVLMSEHQASEDRVTTSQRKEAPMTQGRGCSLLALNSALVATSTGSLILSRYSG